MDSLLFRTLRPRVRRLTDKVQDSLPLPMDKLNPQLLLTDKLNLLPLTERL